MERKQRSFVNSTSKLDSTNRRKTIYYKEFGSTLSLRMRGTVQTERAESIKDSKRGPRCYPPPPPRPPSLQRYITAKAHQMVLK